MRIIFGSFADVASKQIYQGGIIRGFLNGLSIERGEINKIPYIKNAEDVWTNGTLRLSSLKKRFFFRTPVTEKPSL